jgi:hypothetical protein
VGRFDDVVGRGWTLLSPVADPVTRLDPEAAAYFSSLGGISAYLGPSGAVQDLDGVYARWFGATTAAVVLQRPDFYVFGTAARLDDVNALVDQVRQVVTRP